MTMTQYVRNTTGILRLFKARRVLDKLFKTLSTKSIWKYTKLIWKRRIYSPCDKDCHFVSYRLEAILLLTEYASHK